MKTMLRCFSRNILFRIGLSAVFLTPFLAEAGGITLGGTRIIYPADQKQVSLSIRNTDDQASFMVQSWVEESNGKKTQDFVVTPPLYVSGPSNENTLRLMFIGQPVRTDQETLFYFNTKAIPSIDKNKMEGKNVLMLAAITRLKLFVRPAGLAPSVDKAQAALQFQRVGRNIRIDNPTPYYITLTQIKVGGEKLDNTMVSPRGSVSLTPKKGEGNTVTYRTINDYGAVTKEMKATLK